MKRSPLLLFHTVFITLLLLLVTAAPAAAEEGETPQIALSVYEASPGATIEITGGRFEPDIQVRFMLFQNGAEIQLGTILCDDHGEFLTPLLLPVELQVGQYEFRAVDEKNRVAVALLDIVADEGAGDADLQRQDDDGLLAPMPTIVGQPTPGSSAQTEARAAFSGNTTKVLLALLAVLVILTGVGLNRKIFRK